MRETANTPSSDDMVDLGEGHHKAGRLQEAELSYRKALEIDPGHPGALYYLATIAYDDGRLPLATQLLDALLRDDPTDAEAWHLLGVTAHKDKNFSRAIECLNKALAIQPAYIQAYYSIGNIFQDQHKIDEALSSYRQAINLKPNFEPAYEKIGFLLLSLEKWDEAIAIFRKALAENADSALIHAGLGAALSSANQHVLAVDSFERALALNPDYPDIHCRHANALRALNRLNEALTSYDSALALKPDYAEAYCSRGDVLRELKRSDEALVSYDKALALKPDYSEAYEKRGNLLGSLKQSDETQSALLEARAHKNIDIVTSMGAVIEPAPSSYRVAQTSNPVQVQLTCPIPPGTQLHYTDYQYAPSHFVNKKIIPIDGHDVRVVAQRCEPEIVVFENILSDVECELLIDLSRPRLAPSKTVDPESAVDFMFSETRTSEGASFRREENAFLRTIEKRLAKLMNLPINHGEGVQILHYPVGAQYEPHYDYFLPENMSTASYLQKAGQRVATLIMYLNDVESGGETVFPEVDFAVKPRRGCGVYFSYCDAAGKLDRLTLHGGAPVRRGEKWIATKWIRQRAWEFEGSAGFLK